MALTTMKGTLLVTTVTITALFVLAEGRSVSKEIIKLSNHINSQFGFDYSNDEEFFSLIGVEGDESELYDSYEDVDVEEYSSQYNDAKQTSASDEYDEVERNYRNNVANEKSDKFSENLTKNGPTRGKSGDISGKFEENNEYDKNDDSIHVGFEKTRQLNKLNNDKIKRKKTQTDPNNSDEDNIVNDYEELNEPVFDSNYRILLSKEDTSEEEDNYDEDYDYEDDGSKENGRSYLSGDDDDENKVDKDEDYENDSDYYEDYEDSKETENGEHYEITSDDEEEELSDEEQEDNEYEYNIY